MCGNQQGFNVCTTSDIEIPDIFLRKLTKWGFFEILVLYTYKDLN